MSKQTAVEWLWDESQSRELQADDFEKALDIEKLQIIEAYRDGRTDQQSGIDKWKNRSSSSYYNETYGGQDGC
jgi:hypothetical protein